MCEGVGRGSCVCAGRAERQDRGGGGEGVKADAPPPPLTPLQENYVRALASMYMQAESSKSAQASSR